MACLHTLSIKTSLYLKMCMNTSYKFNVLYKILWRTFSEKIFLFNNFTGIKKHCSKYFKNVDSTHIIKIPHWILMVRQMQEVKITTPVCYNMLVFLSPLSQITVLLKLRYLNANHYLPFTC